MGPPDLALGEVVGGAAQPAALGRPLTPFLVVPRSGAVQATEDALGHALVAFVGGTRPPVSVADVQHYLRDRFELLDEEFDVRHHYPEDFVVWFRHGADRERVLAARPSALWLPWSGDHGGVHRRATLESSSSEWWLLCHGCPSTRAI